FTFATLQFSKFVVIDREAIQNLLNKYSALPYYIIGLGIFIRIIESFLPPSLAFIGFLTINSSLIGLGLLYFSKTSWLNKWIVTIIVFLPLIFQSINTGMFHTIIIWGVFCFSFINLAKRIKFRNKILILSFSISLLFTLQSVKKDYRETIYSSSFKGNKLELFIDLFLGKATTDNQFKKEIDTETEQSNINARLNQGWIISKIYNRIPEKKDFIGGETIMDAISVSLVPRILAPNKKGGGGRATFEKLTGFTLMKNTAMGVSLLGEFYGNFGFYGAMLCFLIWGKLLNFVVRVFQRNQKNSAIIVFFLPIVFFQVIKAESDLTTVLNHLVKSIIFVTLFIFFMRKVMNIRI
ncbi:MAG: O-antigen polysaccharide polymerase Wzy, partial [Vicingaceae bacterium]|nr:O-antigen polysaccharide polymerase Wzy [Vicingaceae bacterium]